MDSIFPAHLTKSSNPKACGDNVFVPQAEFQTELIAKFSPFTFSFSHAVSDRFRGVGVQSTAFAPRAEFQMHTCV